MRFLLVVALLLPHAASSAPAIVFDEHAVLASGITPGQPALFFSISREPRPNHWRVTRLDEVVADMDRDGLVRLETRGPVHRQSAWAVVDLRTGQLAIASPAGSTWKAIESPADGFQRGSGGQLVSLVSERDFLEILTVRPGVGAWKWSGGDGGNTDDEAASGRLAATLQKMTAVLPGVPAPPHFAPADVVIVIDPDRLEVWTTRIGN